MATLSPEASGAFAALLSRVPRRGFRAPAVVYRELDPPDAAYFVHDGLVKLETTHADGTTTLVAFRGPLELVGEHSAFDGGTRMTDALVVVDATLSKIDHDDLRAVVLAHPELGMVLLSTLAAHLRATTQHIHEMTSGDPVALIANRLGDLATHRRFAAARTTIDGSIEIEMPITHADLAAWAGVSQRATATAFRELRTCGSISTGRMRLVVHDLDELLHRADRTSEPDLATS